YSLGNQMCAKVILGTLLVFPIENSLLYVEPLYIRAENGQLPELQRVIASYGDQVVMGETLPATLSSLFTSREGEAPPVVAAIAPQASSPTGAPPPPATTAMHGPASESAAAH